MSVKNNLWDNIPSCRTPFDILKKGDFVSDCIHNYCWEQYQKQSILTEPVKPSG